jgi:hypothetical protein
LKNNCYHNSKHYLSIVIKSDPDGQF